MQKRALAHAHEKGRAPTRVFHDLLVDQMAHSVSHGDDQQARCRMLHPGSQVRLRVWPGAVCDRIRAPLLLPEGGEHLS